MADIELNPDPVSTYGATEEYKAAWHAKYGKSEDEATSESPESSQSSDPAKRTTSRG